MLWHGSACKEDLSVTFGDSSPKRGAKESGVSEYRDKQLQKH